MIPSFVAFIYHMAKYCHMGTDESMGKLKNHELTALTHRLGSRTDSRVELRLPAATIAANEDLLDRAKNTLNECISESHIGTHDAR